MAYQPQPGSLVDRVCRWFLINLEEDMTPADIATRFDVANRSSISALLASGVTHQLLVRAKGDDGVMVYKAGPKLQSSLAQPQAPADAPPQGSSASGFKAWLGQKGEASAEGRPAAPAMPDPSALKIEAGVPMPAARTAANRYDAVFAAMKKDDSFACPAEASKRLIQAAHRFGKTTQRKFALRLIDDNQARIWRIA